MNILLACLAAAQSAQAAPIKVACFGDSVTAGMSNSYCNALCRGDTQDEVARSRSLRSVHKSAEKKTKNGFFEAIELGQNREHSIAIGLRPVTGAADNSAAAASTSAPVHSCIDYTLAA